MKSTINIRSKVIGQIKDADFNYDEDLIVDQLITKKIIQLSGYLYTYQFNYQSSDKSYIKDIKETNILGRKGLSDDYPILGVNLNTVPKIIRDNQGGKAEIWKIIKVSEWQKQIGPYIQQYPAFVQDILTSALIKTETIILTGNINDNYLINYPQYLEIQPEKAYKVNVDQFLEYYCYETNNTFYFQDWKNFETEFTDKFVFGPIASYEFSVQILKKYCQLNNININLNTDNSKQLIFTKNNSI